MSEWVDIDTGEIFSNPNGIKKHRKKMNKSNQNTKSGNSFFGMSADFSTAINILALLIAIMLFLPFIKLFIKNIFGDLFSGVKSTYGDLDDKMNFNSEINNYINTSTQIYPPSISDSAAHNFANRLFYAMDGLGTDTEALYELADQQIYNPTDVLMIYREFGLRSGTSYFSNTKEDLIRWIKADLNFWNWDLKAQLKAQFDRTPLNF
jgi:hypothetical protein